MRELAQYDVLVMGIGNILWADEGFGVRVAERLYAHYHWPEYVEIVDGGTQGLNLLGYVESASHLLILDAIDYGLDGLVWLGDHAFRRCSGSAHSAPSLHVCIYPFLHCPYLYVLQRGRDGRGDDAFVNVHRFENV